MQLKAAIRALFHRGTVLFLGDLISRPTLKDLLLEGHHVMWEDGTEQWLTLTSGNLRQGEAHLFNAVLHTRRGETEMRENVGTIWRTP